MSYHFTTRISGSFDEVLESVIQRLANEGFGVLTQIDVQATFEEETGD